MNECILALIKLRHAARSVNVDKQDLPSIPKRLDNEWIMGAGSSGNGRHASMLHGNLNKHKG
jgi:hypothetical protein